MYQASRQKEQSFPAKTIRNLLTPCTTTGAILLLLALQVFATDLTWEGTVSMDWDNPANWNPNQVPTASDHVIVSSGSLIVPNSATFASLDWSRGTINGSLTVASNSVLTLSGNGEKFLFGTLTNAGILNWIDGVWYITPCLGGGPIVNLASGLVEVQCDQSLTYAHCDGDRAVFQNAGTVRKTSGAGTTYINIPFDNSGVIESLAGTFFLNRSGTIDGTYRAAAGANVNISGNYTNGIAPVVEGLGNVQFIGGTLTLLKDVIPHLQLNGGAVALGPDFQGGTITNLTLVGTALHGSNTVTGNFNCGGGGTGNLLIAPGATMNWTGGNLSGSLTVAHQGVLNLAGSREKFLYGTLTNAGTLHWTDGTWYITPCLGGGPIVNLAGGLVDVQSDQSLTYAHCDGDRAVFQNAGTVRKSSGVGTTYINIPLDNSGLIESLAGTLFLNRSGTIDGTFSAAEGASLSINGNYTNGIAPIVEGLGTVQFIGGTLTLLDDVIPHLQLNGGSVALGTNFQGGTITNLTLAGTGLNGSNTVTGVFNCGGGGTGNLLIAPGATMNWTGGNLSGSLTIAHQGVLNLAGGREKFLFGTLTNAGTLNWTGGTWYITPCLGGGPIVNLAGGLVDIQSDQSLTYAHCDGDRAVFQNAGTVRKSSGIATTYINIPFDNSGVVESLAGTFYLNRSGIIDGRFSATEGAGISFSGNFTNGVAPVVEGLGTIQFAGGTLTLLEDVIANLQLHGGSLALGPNFQGGTITNLSLQGSSINGNFIVSGLLEWTTGTIGGSMFVAATGRLVLDGGHNKYLNATLTNAGSIRWRDGNWLVGPCYGGGPIVNLPGALLEIEGDQNLNIYNCDGESGYFRNEGTIRKTTHTGTTAISIPFHNSGTIAAWRGRLVFYHSYQQTGGELWFGLRSVDDYGAISILGNVALQGLLGVEYLDNFVPVAGNSWSVLNYGSASGTFTNLILPLGSLWTTNYGPGSFTVATVDPATPVLTELSATPIVFGDALSVSMLGGVATMGPAQVAGRLSFVNPSFIPDAGTSDQPVVFRPTDTTNFQSSFATVSVVVVPLTPVVTTWPQATAIIFHQSLGSSFLTNGQGSVPGHFAFGDPNEIPPSAGTFAATVLFIPESSGYSIVTSNVFVMVNKASAEVVLAGLDRTYDATPKMVTARTVPEGLTVNVTYNDVLTAPVVAGTHPISASVIDSNYSGTVTGLLTIAPAPLTVTAHDATKVYGAGMPDLTGSLNGAIDPDGLSLTFHTDATMASPVSDYVIHPIVNDPDHRLSNYQVTTNAGNLSVTPALLTVTADAQTRSYGVTNPILTVSLEGYVNGDLPSVVSGSALLETTATLQSEVGAYPITVDASPLSAANYSFTTVPGWLTVTPAELWVTADPQARLYGQTNPVLTATIDGFLNGDFTNVVAGLPVLETSAALESPAGSYEITVNLGDLSATNYTFVASNGVLIVGKSLLNVRANNQERAYGESNPNLTYHFEPALADTNLVSGEPLVTSTAASDSFIGPYPISVSPGSLASSNYVFTFTEGTLTITNAVLNITGVVVADKTYTGTTDASLDFSAAILVGVVGTDDVTLDLQEVTAEFDNPSAGSEKSVSITGLALSGATAVNYNLLNPALSGTILKPQPALTWSDPDGISYGTALSFTQLDALADTSGSFVYTPSSGTVLAVGASQTLRVDFTPEDTANYEGASAAVTVNVVKATLVARAVDQVKNYGHSNPALTINYDGFVNGDGVESLDAAPNITTSARTDSEAGIYPITLSGGSDDSYTFTSIDGLLTVNPDDFFGIILLETAAIYSWHKAPVKVDAAALLVPGGRTHFGGGQLFVTIVSNAAPGDLLSVYDQGTNSHQISVSDGVIHLGSVAIAEVRRENDTGEALVVQFNTNATAAGVQMLVREISFATTNRSKVPRCVELMLTDGLGGVSEPSRKMISLNVPLPIAPADGESEVQVTAGVYTGLIMDPTDSRPERSGYFRITLTTQRTFSGYIRVAGRSRVSFNGRFNAAGQASAFFAGSRWGVDLELIESTDQVRGRITAYGDGGWSGDVSGYRSGFPPASPLTSLAGRYTIRLPDNTNSALPLFGHGFAAVKVNKSGQASLQGMLPDGRAFECGTTLSSNGLSPVYVSLDNRKGLLMGWLRFSELDSSVSGTLTWIKPSQSRFPNGVAVEMDVIGSRYLPSSFQGSLLSSTDLRLTVSGGDLSAPLSNTVTVVANGTFVDHGGDIAKLRFSLTLVNGLLRGSFLHPKTGQLVRSYGIILDQAASGFGFFLGPTQGGSLRLDF